MSGHSNRLALLDSKHRLQILQQPRNYANVTYNLLPYNMQSATLTKVTQVTKCTCKWQVNRTLRTKLFRRFAQSQQYATCCADATNTQALCQVCSTCLTKENRWQIHKFFKGLQFSVSAQGGKYSLEASSSINTGVETTRSHLAD